MEDFLRSFHRLNVFSRINLLWPYSFYERIMVLANSFSSFYRVFGEAMLGKFYQADVKD